MKLQVNEKSIELDGSTVKDLLVLQGLADKSGFAVAVNETVVSRDEWQEFELSENDSVLIIQPTQGG